MIHDPDRDRLVPSKGHSVLAKYAARIGIGVMLREELGRVKTLEGMMQSHPDMEKTPALESATGSPGQGLSIGPGLAPALRLDRPPSRVWVITGRSTSVNLMKARETTPARSSLTKDSRARSR